MVSFYFKTTQNAAGSVSDDVKEMLKNGNNLWTNGLLACISSLLHLQLSLECASFNLKLLIAVIEVKFLQRLKKLESGLQHEMRR